MLPIHDNMNMSLPPCSFIMKLPQTDLEIVDTAEEALEPQNPETQKSLLLCSLKCLHRGRNSDQHDDPSSLDQTLVSSDGEA